MDLNKKVESLDKIIECFEQAADHLSQADGCIVKAGILLDQMHVSFVTFDSDVNRFLEIRQAIEWQLNLAKDLRAKAQDELMREGETNGTNSEIR